MALPDLCPIFHGSHPASSPLLGVGAGGPTQRQGGQEAASLSVRIPALAQGQLSLARAQQPMRTPLLAQREPGPLPNSSMSP